MSTTDHDLATQLSIALSAVRAHTETRGRSAIGVGVSEQRALLALSGRPAPFRDVCGKTQMDKGALSRTVAELKARGLVKTSTAASSNRHVLKPLLFIQLTPTGSRLRKVIQRHLADADAAILQALKPSERAALPAILAKLIALGGAE